jgi:hypothetical protein
LRRYAVRIIETNRRWLHCKPKTKDYWCMSSLWNCTLLRYSRSFTLSISELVGQDIIKISGQSLFQHIWVSDEIFWSRS